MKFEGYVRIGESMADVDYRIDPNTAMPPSGSLSFFRLPQYLSSSLKDHCEI